MSTRGAEALLERIIQASSNEGDTVLDAYCGCGTSVAVAQRLRRHWIGIDITYQSIAVILKRLEDSFGAVALDALVLDGIPRDMASARARANMDLPGTVVIENHGIGAGAGAGAGEQERRL